VSATRRTPGRDAAPIERAWVIEVEMTLLEPFVTSFGTTATRHTVLVRLIDAAGAAAWGEAAPLDHPFYLPDTVSGAFSTIVDFALPLCLRSGAVTGRDAAAAMAPIRANTFARAGVEAAFWALEAEREGCSLRDLVGGVRDRIEVGESIGMKRSIDETLEEVELRLRVGYRRIKLKIARGWDLEVVRAVREAFGDIALQVDANGGYAVDDAEHLAKLDRFGLVCLEQPLPFDDLLGHAELQARLDTPICLDESLRSAEDVRRAFRIGACRNVNLKPGRVGGLTESLAVHALCVDEGVPLWCGGMLESGIGRAINLALASLPGFTQAADMSPASVLFTEDLIDPTYMVEGDGCIAVPSAPGLGFHVDDQRVRARTVRRVELDGEGNVMTVDTNERSAR
jgi:o-succinylbenzoate synthase